MFEIARLGSHEGPRLRGIRLRALACTPEDWTTQVTDLPTFVAAAAGVDVGLVRCGHYHRDASAVWLYSMWVAPAMRGRGIGTRLVAEVVAWARAEGCRRVLLEVADDNDAAIALYAKCGFVPNGLVGSLPTPREHVGEHQRELRLD